MKLPKYSIGVGDRFGKQGEAQLSAIMQANALGADVTPVWNKSFREHSTIHTQPIDTRREADAAVQALGWDKAYFVDADHVNFNNIETFIACSTFFTLDVADYIGERADNAVIATFVEKSKKFIGELSIPKIDEKFVVTEQLLAACAEKYLYAVQQAGKIYRHIVEEKGAENFVTEVSMDETDAPQTPIEMLFILAAIAAEGIPAQTIAPKFTGRFNKGVDYVGDVAQFTKEFRQDLAVIEFAIQQFGLPENLKLSVHSGSDKFSIYAPISQAIQEFNAGLHLKTAGTTWLEELVGLAEAGGDGLQLAKEIYRKAFGRYDELAKPYATVIDIDEKQLPTPDEVDTWDSMTFADSLRHVQSNEKFNQHFRQLLHVGYKVAAEMGERYLQALDTHKTHVAKNVTENIFERHLKPLFTLV